MHHLIIRRQLPLLLVLGLTLSAAAALADSVQSGPLPDNRAPIDHVRFFPAPGYEKDMVGGKFEGSNESSRSGYETLAEITTAPAAGQWTELALPTTTAYRWLRYEAPPGSYGRVAEIEFYAKDQKIGFGNFGSLGHRDARAYMMGIDGKTDTYFESTVADGQYVGTDAGYWVDPQPFIQAKPASAGGSVQSILTEKDPRVLNMAVASKDPVQVTISADQTPDTVIRYEFNGSPTATTGQVYSGPITIDHTTTIFAATFRKGFAPSPVSSGICVIGDVTPGHTSLHIGNSLTDSSRYFSLAANSAGIDHHYQTFELGGAPVSAIWNKYVEHPDLPTNDKISWNQQIAALNTLDDLTLQVHDTKLDEEVEYMQKFMDLFSAKFPDMQPWLYSVWAEMFKPPREVQIGQVKSFEMKTLYAPPTWQEQDAAWLLYAEDVQTQLTQTYKGKKKPHILPNSIAAAWLKTMIDHGQIPGLHADDLPFAMFADNYHPGPIGRYLLELVWYAAIYHDSPVGKIAPVLTELTPEQATVIQKLAWDVVRNYPDDGLYQEGATPVGAPQFSFGAAANGMTPVTLTSSTPGAWFRYTLDGTTPTRNCGYIYCGIISLKPGMTLKAVAYESGMADSTAVQAPQPQP
jgi:hypothetical protein